MESPPQVRKILDQIHGRIPDAMLIAMRIHFGTLPASAAADREDVACSLRQLQSRARPTPAPTTAAPRAPLRLSSGSCYVPHHDEDFHFCHDVCGVVAVADGVGGCRGEGVDAAAFSEVATSEFGKPVCPYEILDRAYRRTAASGTPAASTAVVVSLAGRVLRWAYVGDSGFAVFRDGKMLRRFQPQQWYFNCPFQLCAANGVTKVGDAAVGEMAVEEGDVLVVASDGLFDNVSDSALENLVQSSMLLGFTPEEVAGIMAFRAYVASKDPTTDSPFSIASREQGQARTGGKEDDITAVVAFIESQDSGFFGLRFGLGETSSSCRHGFCLCLLASLLDSVLDVRSPGYSRLLSLSVSFSVRFRSWRPGCQDTVGVKLELTKNFEMGVSNRTAEFIKMKPLRKVARSKGILVHKAWFQTQRSSMRLPLKGSRNSALLRDQDILMETKVDISDEAQKEHVNAIIEDNIELCAFK
ncbi:hypothetical protein ACQ4PT_012816 [Festuca glaucescens]